MEGTNTGPARPFRCPITNASLRVQAFRTSTLNRFRVGAKVVEITHDHEEQTVLRFFGYLVHTVCEVREPTMSKVFCDQEVGLTVEKYAQWLEEKQLQWSSIANYLSAILSAAQFATVGMAEPPPLDQLANLRRQVSTTSALGCPAHAENAHAPSCRRRKWPASKFCTESGVTRGLTGKM